MLDVVCIDWGERVISWSVRRNHLDTAGPCSDLTRQLTCSSILSPATPPSHSTAAAGHRSELSTTVLRSATPPSHTTAAEHRSKLSTAVLSSATPPSHSTTVAAGHRSDLGTTVLSSATSHHHCSTGTCIYYMYA